LQVKEENMDRIQNHPILGESPVGKSVTFTYDGRELTGYEGEPIAMALKVNGIMIHRYPAKRHEPRGIFCDIGRCTDCVMVVDGQPNVRTCITPLRAGMKVETQYGAGAKPFDEAGADTSAESTGKDAREEKRS
jgi:hypothetical protein